MRKKTHTKQVSVRISSEFHERLTDYCTANKITMTALFISVFNDFLDERSDRVLLMKKLDRVYSRLEIVDSTTAINLELLDAWIKAWFMHTPMIPRNQQEAAASAGRKQYDTLMKFLRKSLNSGRRVIDEFIEPVDPGKK